MDMDMDMSSGSVVVRGGSRVRPIGVSPSLLKITDPSGAAEDWFHGNKWPPIDVAAAWVRAEPAGNGFPRKYWDPKLLAVTVLGEFVLIKSGAGPA